MRSVRVSWLLAFWNPRRDWLCQAINSMRSQSILRDEVEFIIVDDGSDDRSFIDDIQKMSQIDPRFSPTRIEHSGLAYALNRGLELCTGKLVCRLDADDFAMPGRLEAQVPMFDDCHVCGGFAQVINEDGSSRRLGTEDKSDPMTWLSHGRVPVLHPTVLMSREAVMAVNGYPMAYPHAEDYALWCLLARNDKRFRVVNDLVTTIRRHRHAMSEENHVVQVQSRCKAMKELL